MDYDKHQCIIAAVEALKEAKSWTGKTHLQKALALASLVLGKDLPFEFVLYKHGPYSFDVDHELGQMETYDAVLVVQQPAPYGPTLKIGSGASFPRTLGSESKSVLETIRRSAKFAGDRNVLELESLATSAWIRIREEICGDDAVAKRLSQLKPHLAGPQVSNGVQDSKKFVAEFGLA